MSKITDDVLEDIFDTAMEGGITYWCGFREGSFIDIIAGNAVTLTCTDDEEKFDLTKMKLVILNWILMILMHAVLMRLCSTLSSAN